MPIWIYVFLGGGLGSVARWTTAKWLSPSSDHAFPIGTFTANLIACLILGLLIGYQLKHPIQHQYRLFLMVGFCGGFSTFSTFSAETFNLLRAGQLSMAIGYVAISLLFGLVAVFAGIKICEY